jgi:integrase
LAKVFLTETVLSSAICPQNKDQEIYWDYPVASDGQIRNGSMPGLGLRVTALGNKSFVHAYRFNGKRYRKVLGSTVLLSIASARLTVAQRERQLAAGENPDLDNADPRRAHLLTVREAIDRYWDGHIKELSEGYRESFALFVGRWHRKQPKTASRRGRNIRKTYTDFGTLFADRPLTSIKPSDIEHYQKQFVSPYGYNDGLCRMSSLFNWAIRMQLVDMRNPCDPIRPRKVVRRRRDYSSEQIKQIAAHIFYPTFEAIPDITELAGCEKRDRALAKARSIAANDQMAELSRFMGILFLTMARPSDLLNAKFEHFDLEKLIWHKHNTKGIKLSRAAYEYAFRSVPIHPKVAELAEAQRLCWPDSVLLFPSHTDTTRPRESFRKGLARFKALPGVPEYFQLYDLKRIAISLMLTGQGVSHDAVSHYVDHKGNLETTMIYDLGLVDPLRPVTEKLGQLLGV